MRWQRKNGYYPYLTLFLNWRWIWFIQLLSFNMTWNIRPDSWKCILLHWLVVSRNCLSKGNNNYSNVYSTTKKDIPNVTGNCKILKCSLVWLVLALHTWKKNRKKYLDIHSWYKRDKNGVFDVVTSCLYLINIISLKILYFLMSCY